MPCSGSLQCRVGRSNAVGWSLQCRAFLVSIPAQNSVVVDNFLRHGKKQLVFRSLQCRILQNQN